MPTIARALVALTAAAMAGVALGLWFALDQTAPLLGLTPDPMLARASIRADNGSLFFMLALLSGYGALKLNRTAVKLAAIVFLIALSGRMLTLVLDGPVPNGLQPMLIEAVGAAIMVLAYLVWSNAPAPH